eukprot:353742-Chlamydomonas_euryale.AAC.2
MISIRPGAGRTISPVCDSGSSTSVSECSASGHSLRYSTTLTNSGRPGSRCKGQSRVWKGMLVRSVQCFFVFFVWGVGHGEQKLVMGPCQLLLRPPKLITNCRKKSSTSSSGNRVVRDRQDTEKREIVRKQTACLMCKSMAIATSDCGSMHVHEMLV